MTPEEREFWKMAYCAALSREHNLALSAKTIPAQSADRAVHELRKLAAEKVEVG